MMKVFNVPNGPRNIQALFPAVNFKNIAKYYLEIQDNTGVVIATTPINELQGGCCGKNAIRVHFLNYLGTIDAVNFNLALDEHETKSELIQKITSNPLIKRQHGVTRYNVRSNDTLTLSCIDYQESSMKWLDELLDSPLTFMEWTGTQGQADDYIPLVIQDTKKINFKQDDRWFYEVIVQVKMSHERIIIRN